MISIRLTSLRKRLLVFVVLPSALVAFYYLIWASDMYISETRFSLHSPEVSGGSDILSMFGHSLGTSNSDSYIVNEYILSADMLQKLEKRLGLKNHFQNSSADFISRLKSSPSAEEFLKYYQGAISSSFDTTTGILIVKTRAYTPEMARDIGQAILEESELLVNRLRERTLQDGLVLARNELEIAEQRVNAAREAMNNLRRDTHILSPEATAASLQQLVTNLEAELAKTRAELSTSRTYMREDSPQVILLKTRIAGLERQAAAERSRLVGGDGLNEMAGDFERLTQEHDFAQKQYSFALNSIEVARVRAESKARYLVPFATPTLPDEALYPKRWLFSGLAFVTFALIYGIVSLTIAAIREHAGF